MDNRIWRRINCEIDIEINVVWMSECYVNGVMWIGLSAALFCFILCILCNGELTVFGWNVYGRRILSLIVQACETNLFKLTSDEINWYTCIMT